MSMPGTNELNGIYLEVLKTGNRHAELSRQEVIRLRARVMQLEAEVDRLNTLLYDRRNTDYREPEPIEIANAA